MNLQQELYEQNVNYLLYRNQNLILLIVCKMSLFDSFCKQPLKKHLFILQTILKKARKHAYFKMVFLFDNTKSSG